MPIPDHLLSILVCPENRRALHPLPAKRLAALNARIARGEVNNSAGRTLTHPLTEALVREGDDRVYPVEQSIPVLLVEEGIPLAMTTPKPKRARGGSR